MSATSSTDANQGEANPSTPAEWHRRVFQLTWPVLLANVSIPLVGIVDTYVMGRLPSEVYIGAVAIGAQIFSAFYWIFGFLRMATTGLSAQSWGARDSQKIVATMWRSSGIALALGCALVALQIPIALLMLGLFDASDTVESLARVYFDIRIWGAPAYLLQMVMLGVLFGLQQMRATLWVSLILNVTNIALDFLFVLGLDMGVAGVATATIIAEWLAASVAALLVWRTLKRQGFSLPIPKGIWRGEALQELFSVSGNLVIRTFFVQLPFFVVTWMGAKFGDVTLAANAVLMQLFMLMAFGVDALAHTAEALTGKAFGARQPQVLRQASFYSTVWGLVSAVVIALLYTLFGSDFVALLSTSESVRATANEYLIWMILCPIACFWAFVADGIFIGCTRVVALRNSMFFSALVFLAVLVATVEPLGNHGLWLAFVLFMLARSVLLAQRYPEVLAAATARP